MGGNETKAQNVATIFKGPSPGSLGLWHPQKRWERFSQENRKLSLEGNFPRIFSPRDPKCRLTPPFSLKGGNPRALNPQVWKSLPGFAPETPIGPVGQTTRCGKHFLGVPRTWAQKRLPQDRTKGPREVNPGGCVSHKGERGPFFKNPRGIPCKTRGPFPGSLNVWRQPRNSPFLWKKPKWNGC